MANTHTTQTVHAVEALIQREFANKSFLLEALAAPGSRILAISDRMLIEGNKPLAMIGDAILKTLLIKKRHEAGDQRGWFLRHHSKTLSKKS